MWWSFDNTAMMLLFCFLLFLLLLLLLLLLFLFLLYFMYCIHKWNDEDGALSTRTVTSTLDLPPSASSAGRTNNASSVK